MKIYIATFSDYECNNIISVHETEEGAKLACREHRKMQRRKWLDHLKSMHDFLIEEGTKFENGYNGNLTDLKMQRPFMNSNFWMVDEVDVLK